MSDTTTSPPGANTKPVPATVTAALAKARKKESNADLVPGDTVTAEVVDTPDSLDRQLRGCARDVDQSWARLAEAVTAVITNEVHDALGFKSVVAYLADVMRTEMPDLAGNLELRRHMVALLDEQAHLSQRAISAVVGVSQKTVDRDLDQLSREDSVGEQLATVTDLDGKRTGLDGKQRPAHPKPRPAPEPETQDAATEPVEPLDVDVVPEEGTAIVDADASLALNTNIIIEDAEYLTQLVPHLLESVKKHRISDASLIPDKRDDDLTDQLAAVADMLMDAGRELHRMIGTF